MMTMQSFLQKYPVKLETKLTDCNPNMSDWRARATHWRCTLKYRRKQMSLYFSQGPAIAQEPTVADILNCLATDASGSDSPFEEWARDLGYDPDSRKAEKTYLLIQKQARQLSTLLGPDAYQALLDDVDRL